MRKSVVAVSQGEGIGAKETNTISPSGKLITEADLKSICFIWSNSNERIIFVRELNSTLKAATVNSCFLKINHPHAFSEKYMIR